jgi:hypothetical protein
MYIYIHIHVGLWATHSQHIHSPTLNKAGHLALVNSTLFAISGHQILAIEPQKKVFKAVYKVRRGSFGIFL